MGVRLKFVAVKDTAAVPNVWALLFPTAASTIALLSHSCPTSTRWQQTNEGIVGISKQ